MRKGIEKLAIGMAWVMALTMLALGAVHVGLVVDLIPIEEGTGWIPVIGEVPTILMPLAWEFPSGAIMLAGLVFEKSRLRLAGIAVAVGALSLGVHLFYFPVVLLIAVLVAVSFTLRSMRFTVSEWPFVFGTRAY